MRCLIAIILLCSTLACKKSPLTQNPVKPKPEAKQPLISKTLSNKDIKMARQLLLTDPEKYHTFLLAANDIRQEGKASKTIALDYDPGGDEPDGYNEAIEDGGAVGEFTWDDYFGLPVYESFLKIYGLFAKRGNEAHLDYKFTFSITSTGFIFRPRNYVQMDIVGPAVGEISPASGYLNIFDDYLSPPQGDIRVYGHAESICEEKRTRIISTTGAVKFNAGFNAGGAQIGGELSAGFTVQDIVYTTGRFDMTVDVVFNRTINNPSLPIPSYSYTLTGVNYGYQQN